MNMKIKTAIKVLLFSILSVVYTLFMMALGSLLIEPVVGAFVGLIIAVFVLIAIVGQYFPVWFKDYIEEYWRKWDEKNKI